jgi:hypothetical protein
MSERGKDGRPPEPGQAVAAATTKTDQPQDHARHIRETGGLKPDGHGEGCARPDDMAPPYARMLSEARAVEEALACLGRGASADDVRRELERTGIRIRLDDVRRILVRLEPRRTADLVRTEGEAVPPPAGDPS